jgi:hypothetical protein
VSAHDGSKHASGNECRQGIPLCQWERNCDGDLIASWRRGCTGESRTPLNNAVTRCARGDATDDPEDLIGQPPVPRPALRRIATTAIAVVYVIVVLALVVASGGTEPL